MGEGASSVVNVEAAARLLVDEGRAVVTAALARAGVREGDAESPIAVVSSDALHVQIARVRAENPSTYVLAVVAAPARVRDALAAGADDVATLEEAAVAERLTVAAARVAMRGGSLPAAQHHSLITLGLRGTVEQGGLDAAARELTSIASEMLRADRVTLALFSGEALRLVGAHGAGVEGLRRDIPVAEIEGWAPAGGARQIVCERAEIDARVAPLVRAAVVESGARVLEHVVPRGNGEYVVLRCERASSSAPWEDADQPVSSFVLQAAMRIFSDAAALREEEDARERARRLDATLHSIGDAVIATDAANRIVRMNPAACRLLGKTFEEVRGTPCPDVLRLVDEASKQPLPDPTTEVLESGTTLVETAGPTFLECVGGSLRPVALTASPIRDGEGSTIGAIVVFRDRSEELEIELALASVAANEAANRHRAEFLAMMNHEMRTPLNGVLGMTTVLLATTLSDEQREYAETVRTSGEQLLRLIDDILDYAKLEAQKLDLASIQFDPLVVVDAVCSQMAELAFNQGLEFNVVVSPTLPRACSGDPTRLRQVLVHLVDNAIKFTDAGEIVLRIEPAGTSEGVAYWNFRVTDTGVGIAEADRTNIFKPFVQLDSSMTRRHGGSGLGLALVRQLVDLMGGDVTVESAPGKGSSFRVTLPLREGSIRTERDDRPSFRSDKPVLLVSAVAALRESVALHLEASGLVVTGASGAEEAVAAMRARGDVKFAMIFVDCGEATLDEDGLSAIVSAVGANDGTALVAILPAGRKSQRVGGDLGAFGATLVKPVHPARLREVAQRTIQPSRAAATISGRPRSSGGERGGLGKVLVVDDNSVNLKVCVRMLEKLGYTPATAIGGAEAVEAARTTRFDLVLMDCQMPLVDGYEATRRIRENERELGGRVPIVALTANTTNEDRERAFLSGMDDFVSKPITLEVLDRLLERWVVVTV
jgi:PAS domain S-box-containing protein